MNTEPIVVLEDSAFFKRGQIIEKYDRKEGGIIIEDKFIPKDKFVVLNENLSLADEKRIREMIKQQFKNFFYNLYMRQAIFNN